jgi:hypothetical protein
MRHPTGNGKYNVADFAKELTAIFASHGWSFSEYCDKVWSTQPIKKQPAVATTATVNLTEIESELQKLAAQIK